MSRKPAIPSSKHRCVTAALRHLEQKQRAHLHNVCRNVQKKQHSGSYCSGMRTSAFIVEIIVSFHREASETELSRDTQGNTWIYIKTTRKLNWHGMNYSEMNMETRCGVICLSLGVETYGSYYIGIRVRVGDQRTVMAWSVSPGLCNYLSSSSTKPFLHLISLHLVTSLASIFSFVLRG